MAKKNLTTILKSIEELIVLEDYENAKNLLIKFLNKDPKNPEAYYLLGDVLCKLGNFEASIETLEIADSLLPLNPQITHLLGWAHFMNEEISIGRDLMESALEVMPDEVSLLCDLAVLEMKAGNEKSLEYAEKAMKIDSSDHMAREVFLVTNNFFKSLKELRTLPN